MFKVKAEIQGQANPIYSNAITLNISGEPTPSTDFDWDLKTDNTATLTKYKGQGGEVIIPRTVESGGNTYTVTAKSG